MWGEDSSNDLVAMGGGMPAAHLPPTQQQILEATLPLPAAAALGDGMPAQGPPSRHLWVGNMPVKPNKAAIEAAFASFGPVESVRSPATCRSREHDHVCGSVAGWHVSVTSAQQRLVRRLELVARAPVKRLRLT